LKGRLAFAQYGTRRHNEMRPNAAAVVTTQIETAFSFKKSLVSGRKIVDFSSNIESLAQ